MNENDWNLWFQWADPIQNSRVRAISASNKELSARNRELEQLIIALNKRFFDRATVSEPAQ